jgi:hypothetical protein
MAIVVVLVVVVGDGVVGGGGSVVGGGGGNGGGNGGGGAGVFPDVQLNSDITRGPGMQMATSSLNPHRFRLYEELFPGPVWKQ